MPTRTRIHPRAADQSPESEVRLVRSRSADSGVPREHERWRERTHGREPFARRICVLHDDRARDELGGRKLRARRSTP